MEEKIETTGMIGSYRFIMGLYCDNGQENENYRDYSGYTRVIMGLLYRDNGKEHGV